MRLLKTLGLLALVCLACAPVLFVALGPRGTLSGQAGAALGATIFVFVASAIPAATVHLLRRKSLAVNYPGFGTGVMVAVLLTAAVLVGSQA